MTTQAKNESGVSKEVKGPLSTYYVYRHLPHNGVPYEAGDTIELTAKQARFLIINGFIGKTKTPSKPVKEPAQKKAAK